MDLSNKTDRELQEEVWHATAGRALKPGDGVGVDDLMGKKGDAPPRKQPVAGFERAFGPKPSPGTVESREWWDQVDKTDKVFDAPPTEELAMATARLKFRGGPDIVFIEHEGKLKAAVPPADSDPNFITPERLIESLEGLFINGKFYL
jgi:hypothetical protein